MIIATSLYAALSGIIFTALSVNVVMGRRSYQIALGDSGNPDMKTRVRAHGNFIEYTPLFLVLLLMAEYQGLSACWVHAFGAIFVFGRLVHAYGILVGEPKYKSYLSRQISIPITFTSLIVLAGILIVQFVG